MDKKYIIQDLVNIERLRALFESFSKATGFATSLLSYPEQEVLITAGWRDICTKFHRACPASAECCKASNVSLTDLNELKEVNIRPCANGLVDGATPVVIGGKRLATISTGQVLLAPPNINSFRRLATKYDFAEDEYLAALAKVPVVTEELMKNALCFLSGLAVQIAEEGLSKLMLQESARVLQEENAKRKLAEAKLMEREGALRSLVTNLPSGLIFRFVRTGDGHEQFFHLSDDVDRFYGSHLASPLEAPALQGTTLHPDDALRVRKAEDESARTLTPLSIQSRFLKSDGTVKWMQCRSMPQRLTDGGTMWNGVMIDITESKFGEIALTRANRTLQVLKEFGEALIRARNEADLLDEVCRIVVEVGEQEMAWIGFAENDPAKTVRPVAQAGRYKSFLKTVRVSWADVPTGRGPVGTAIRTRKSDQCGDIEVAPRFAPWRRAAAKCGFRSVIALPLVWDNQCLGALTIYSSKAGGFKEEEVALLERLATDLTFGIIALRTHAEREQLQKELLRISEREKQLISQELHDGLCQNLAGTAFMSTLLHSRLVAKKEQGARLAKKICDLLATSLEEARNLSHGLHPVGPEGEGLMNALSQLAAMVSNLFHIHCTFQCPEPVIIENETVSTHLFRITQEAINNARKHGEADRVTISLRHTPEGLILRIRDNGIGIPVEMSKRSGMGLRFMNHRASEIGATVSVRRAGKRGTEVAVILPPRPMT